MYLFLDTLSHIILYNESNNEKIIKKVMRNKMNNTKEHRKFFQKST